jgi:hypothetical protein
MPSVDIKCDEVNIFISNKYSNNILEKLHGHTYSLAFKCSFPLAQFSENSEIFKKLFEIWKKFQLQKCTWQC